MEKRRPIPPNAIRYSTQSKKVWSGLRFDIHQWEQKQFDGSYQTFEIAKRADSIIVVPVIDNEVVVAKEEQPHWKNPELVFLAGSVNQDEELKEAARRELEEETGMIFEHFHLVYVESAVPSVEWYMYTFIATGYKETRSKKLEPGERNEVLRFPIDTIIQMVREQKFFYRPHFMENYLMNQQDETLKDLLKNPEKYSIPC